MTKNEAGSLKNAGKDKTLLVILGPTASGKTALAVQLAKALEAEVISADSRQVFKEMKIGTARPEPEELQGVPHHLLAFLSIQDDYDAGTFRHDALRILDEIFSRKQYAILCGGSGLYINALLDGFDDLPPVPAALRESIQENYKMHGLSWLQQELSRLDPDYYAEVDQQNPQRLMRALEVCMASGKPFSGFRKGTKSNLNCRIIKIGIEMDRKVLNTRIDARMDEMIANGLFEEAKSLYPFKSKNALQTVGYKEIFDFMDGKHDKAEAVRLLKRNSRRYAKRQLTWFKRDEEIRWFKPEEFEEIYKVVVDS
ncbi:MAG TPA: tRNA (adenosine(37)-N6)-dimethylallyltransferase MiaA [Cyclobacteriaceae bacterium]|nr:tRNA (adenosine(37)-N6)-dimethylallyltransferase MiaA [Cyclobacteriaceae bacterium]